jgi:hypothetical protein
MHSDKRLKMAENSVATHTSLGSTDSIGHPSSSPVSPESSEISGSSGAQHFQAPRRPGFRVKQHSSAIKDAAAQVQEWDSSESKELSV